MGRMGWARKRNLKLEIAALAPAASRELELRPETKNPEVGWNRALRREDGGKRSPKKLSRTGKVTPSPTVAGAAPPETRCARRRCSGPWRRWFRRGAGEKRLKS